jgi:HK97 family phage major capsid protein
MNRQNNRLKLLAWGPLALALLPVMLIAIVALMFLAVPMKAGALTAIAPLIIPKAGEKLDDDVFQRTVMEGINGVMDEQGKFKSAQQKVLDDLDRSDKEVKKALEELTKVKNTCNDFATTMAEMQKVQKAIALNARSSFRDPVQRALANDETRAWLNAVARAAAFPQDYNKLPAEWRKLLEEGNVAAKALTGVDSSLGQSTVPQQTFNEIYDTLLEYGDWTSLDIIRVGMRTTVLPVATARPQFYWIGAGTGGSGETTAITEGAFTGSSVTLSIQTLAAYLLCARELLADSTVDLAPYILNQMVQAISFGMDTAAFISDGTADQTNAGYTGLFNAASANTNLAAIAAAGNTTVEATQLEDWQRVMLTVNPQVLKRNPKWWMQPQILIRALSVKDKNGRPLFQTYTEAPMPGGIGNILGAPVNLTAAAPTTNTAGAKIAVFGDPKGAAVGVRSDLEIATSDDIKFAENMRAFRTLMRAGFKIKTAAASTTLKPFAVLTLAAA